MATMPSVQRLSPGRTEPSRSGDGLPTATYSVFVASSYAGVIHTPPPPFCHASAYLAESVFSFAMSRWRSLPSGVVLARVTHQPPSSGEGIEYHVQASAPVAPLRAFTQPRIPYSHPDGPRFSWFQLPSDPMATVYP